MLLVERSSRLVLASASPRRKELLEATGLKFSIEVSSIDETPKPNETPQKLAERLAELKARAVAAQYPDAYILGADTDVFIEGEILGKPKDEADAARLLRKISGKTHEVWGGFAIVNQSKNIFHLESHLSKVRMVSMSDDLIRSFIKTGEPMDKAGAYAIQGVGALLVSEIEGSYTNVVGLNIAAVVQALTNLGIARVCL